MARRTFSRRGLGSVVFTAGALGGGLASSPAALGQAAPQGGPNIVVINIDDMGFADLAPYNTDAIQADTPTATKLANQGLKFNHYYSGSPICSASRAALLTGQYSSRWGINAFIDNRANNKARDTRDFLSLDAPMVPRTLRDGAGYATANVGKWHLGGGRDVGYNLAPVPTAYGFDQSLTQFEGLGDRVLYQNPNGVGLEGLSQSSKNLGTRNGQDTLYEIQRDQSSAFFVDRAISFVQQTKAANPSKPFFINLAFDDVHTPYDPKPELLAKYQQRYPTVGAEVQSYLAVMENLDTQIGRFVDAIDGAGLGGETLILLTADNGPTGPTYNTGSTGGLRGNKGSLYEGGIREPLIARWTGRIAPGTVNDTTVMHATDMLPSLAAIAGLPAGTGAAANSDGQNMSAALLGDAQPVRTGTLFWDYGRNSLAAGPGPNQPTHSPNLALRDGRYKFLIDADGTKAALYDLSVDPGETNNLVAQQPGRVHGMARQALALRYEMPSLILPEGVGNMLVQLRAENLSQADGATVSTFNDADGGDAFNGSVAQATVSRQPRMIHNAVNGRKALRFDGVDDYLASSQNNRLPNAGRGLTVFMVATGDQSGDPAARAAQIGAAAGTNGRVLGADLSEGESGIRFNNGAAVYDANFDPEDFHIFVFQIDHLASYASATLFVDGTTAANTFTGSATAAGTTNFGDLTLELLLGTGRLGNGTIAGGDHFMGDVAELLVYNEQMTELEINLVANYLSSEYALPFAYDTTSAVPEPATALVAVPALLGMLGMRRRRRRV